MLTGRLQEATRSLLIPAFLVWAAPLSAQQAPAGVSDREVEAVTHCQPWQLGAIQRATAGASVRVQSAQNRLMGLVPTGPSAAQDAPRRDAEAMARAAIRGVFLEDLDAQDMGETLGTMRNHLASVHGRLYSFLLGRLQDPDIGVVCGEQDDRECKGRVGYVSGHHLPIHLCREFFSGADRRREGARVSAIRRGGFDAAPGAPAGTAPGGEEDRVRAMVHESAHTAGIGNAQSESYFERQVCGDDADRIVKHVGPTLAATQAEVPRSDWADAWSLWVTCMNTPGDAPDVVTAPRPRRR